MARSFYLLSFVFLLVVWGGFASFGFAQNSGMAQAATDKAGGNSPGGGLPDLQPPPKGIPADESARFNQERSALLEKIKQFNSQIISFNTETEDQQTEVQKQNLQAQRDSIIHSIQSFNWEMNMLQKSVAAEAAKSVAGEWLCIQSPPPDAMGLLNQKMTVTRAEGGYRVQWAQMPPTTFTFTGDGNKIAHTDYYPMTSVSNLLPPEVIQRMGNQTFAHTFSYTLTGDGNSLEMEEDSIETTWDTNGDGNYYTRPAKAVFELKRITRP